MSNLWTELEQIRDVSIERNKDLKKKSTLQLCASGDLVTIKTVKALESVIKVIQGIEYKVLGLGANQVLDENYDGIYLKLNLFFNKEYLNKTYDSYVLPASCSLAVLTSHAAKYGLKGWEVFTGIPATLGGAISMNAGTNLGEIGSLVSKVKLVTSCGELKEIIIDETSFSYRKANFLNSGDVIYQVELVHFGIDKNLSETIRNYLLKRNNSQPMNAKTCGCVFKNLNSSNLTCRAGEYIDIMGLKGLALGELSVSDLHANFIINNGNGTKQEMLKLIKVINDEMYLQFGIRFNTEVKF